MKILIIGSGGREHALAFKLSSDEKVTKIYVANGNGGTSLENKCENIAIKSNDIPALLKFAIDYKIDLTIVGPEEPLSLGIVDTFEEKNLLVFGVNKDAALMESSKSYAKNIMNAAKIPTAKYSEFTDYESAEKYVKKNGTPIVIKADGLAAGKGVTVAFNMEEALTALKEIFLDKIFGAAGSVVVIEEFMAGVEATYLAITDGKTIIPLSISQDHKQVYDNDKGPNTGGMGAYAPAPIVKGDMLNWVTNNIAYPMINELKKRGVTYKGVIYAGLMVNNNDIKVVEFNARFGDPECQVVLSIFNGSLLPLLIGSAKGDLSQVDTEQSNKYAVCIVLTSGGYPKEFKKGYEISGIEDANKLENVKVFHAGTIYEKNILRTNGGRVLCVTATSDTLQKAQNMAYNACKKIHFHDMHYRIDIANKAINPL